MTGTAPSRRTAFSLVELLVVISVLGLLAGMLYPALSKARALSRSAACKAGLRAVGSAFRMYLDNSNDVMPNAAALASENPEHRPLLADVLGPNLASPESLLCPGDLGRKVFLAEHSSYLYNILMYNDGKPYTTNPFVQMIGEAKTIVLNDAEFFHPDAGGKNFLFADLHVEE